EADAAVVRQLVEVVHVQVTQAVHAYYLAYLLQAVVVGDEVVGAVDVRAEVAGIEEGRRGEPGVDLRGPGLPQQADDARDGRAAHDAVVHEDDPFAAHGGGDGVELYAHGVLAPCLAGLDEGAADVLALHEAHAVGYAALARVAQGRVEA